MAATESSGVATIAAPKTGLAFAHLNLRHNPFGALSPAETASLARIQTDRFLRALEEERSALQFIGDKGAGKTTHLRALCHLIPAATYVRIPIGGRAAIPAGEVLCVDEAQNLSWWARRRLFRFSSRLILGTHVDFAGELRGAGRPLETVQVGDQLTVPLLVDILNARIEAARRGAGDIPVIDEASAVRLMQRFGSNLRAIEGALYERFQGLERAGHVEV